MSSCCQIPARQVTNDMLTGGHFLLFRDLAWHDLAFYNADLYEGLRRMMVDAQSGKSKEEFQATYCCYFEVQKK